MGCCHSDEIAYEKHLEQQRLLGTNYSKLIESAIVNDVNINDCKHIFRDAMNSKYEYTSVNINKYKCVDISVDNGQYTIDMLWKVIKGKIILMSMSYDGGYILSGDRLRRLIIQKITLSDLIDSYFEYIDGHVRSIKDIVTAKSAKIKLHK